MHVLSSVHRRAPLVSAWLRQRLRDESGISLPEMLVGITGGLAVGAAAFGIATAANNSQTRTAYRIEAVNRGRTGMERLVRVMRGAQCVNGTLTPLQYGDPTTIWFYTPVANAGPITSTTPTQIDMHRVQWLAGTDRDVKDGGLPVGHIVDTVWRRASTNVMTPTQAEGQTPTRVDRLAESVQRPGASEPIFSYFGSDNGRPATSPISALPLSAADRATVLMVRIRFDARAKKNKVAKSLTVPFYNRVSIRSPFCS